MSPTPVALLVLALVGQATPSTPDPKLVRVYVFTEAGKTAETAALRESVKDLTTGLAGKKKLVVVVDDEDRADVVIEVVERTRTVPRVVFGLAARPGQPSSGVPPPQRAVHLRVTLAHRDESIELKNKNAPLESAGGWKSAADDIVKQCERWIIENRARLLTNRGKTQDSDPGPRTQDPGPRTGYLTRTRSLYSLNCPFAKPSTSAPIGWISDALL